MVIECLTDISLLTNLQAPTNCGKDHWSKSIPNLWAGRRLPGAFTLPQMKRPSALARMLGLSADARLNRDGNDGPRGDGRGRAPLPMDL